MPGARLMSLNLGVTNKNPDWVNIYRIYDTIIGNTSVELLEG